MFGTARGHGRRVAADAAGWRGWGGWGFPRRGCSEHIPGPRTQGESLPLLPALPSMSPFSQRPSPDIRSLSTRLQRFPWLSLCPPAPGNTRRGARRRDLCTARACPPIQPPQQRWVPAQTKGSGAHGSLSQPPQHLPAPEQTRGWGAAPRFSGLSLGWGSSRSVPGVRSGAAWGGETAGLQPLGLVAILPASLGMSPSLTIVAGLALLRRCCSRKKAASGAFLAHSSCHLAARQHISPRLSRSALCCCVFCSCWTESLISSSGVDLAGPQPHVHQPSRAGGRERPPLLGESPVFCPGGGFFPPNQCFTRNPKQEDLYF